MRTQQTINIYNIRNERRTKNSQQKSAHDWTNIVCLLNYVNVL